jgi:hypothetical protein
MMTLEEEMRELQFQLLILHKRYGRLTHPIIVSVSQQLDEVIMKMYRKVPRPSMCDQEQADFI